MSGSWIVSGWRPYAVAGVAVVGAYALGGWCLAAFAAALAAVAVLVLAQTRREGRAQRAYRDALAALRADPGNPALLQAVVDAGHRLAEATAGGHSEAATRADIEDAAAGAGRPAKGRGKKRRGAGGP